MVDLITEKQLSALEKARPTGVTFSAKTYKILRKPEASKLISLLPLSEKPEPKKKTEDPLI